MTKFSLAISISFLLSACCHEPKSYDDCILDHVKPGMDGSSAGLVMLSCQKKFPKPSTPGRELSSEELSMLTGKAGTSEDGKYFSGSIYNGNDHVTVKEIQVSLSPKIGEPTESRDYRTDILVTPQSASDFSIKVFTVGPAIGYRWKLKSAKGYDVK